MQPPRALVASLLVIALASTVGWIVTARRPATATQPTAAAEAQPHGHGVVAGGTSGAAHAHGGTAQNSPPVSPRAGVVAITVPPLPKTAVNFIWNPQHVQLAAGQQVTFKVANGDYMQHNLSFQPAKVARTCRSTPPRPSGSPPQQSRAPTGSTASTTSR